MTVQELVHQNVFKILSRGEHLEKEISKPFCCDLLSVAMSKASAGSAFITVMANVNTLAVASFTQCSCIVLAEGIEMDVVTIEKAMTQGITVLASKLPVYETAKLVDDLICNFLDVRIEVGMKEKYKPCD